MVYRGSLKRLDRPNYRNCSHLAEIKAMTDNNIVEYLHRIQTLISNTVPLKGEKYKPK